ncbi:hypothetical protein ACB092_06G159300 [Castanea dentata]
MADEKSEIKKRNLHLTEEFLKKSSSICAYNVPSLDARQDIKIMETPKLGAEAARKAIEEWGQPKSKITHLIFHASSGVDMPGCYADGTILRIAKDLAENNVAARVLAVCSEMTVDSFRGPLDSDMSCLVGQAIFGDGAAALIIGANHDTLLEERPLFELVSAAQTIVPNSEGALEAHLREVGLTFYLSKDLPTLVSNSIKTCLVEAFSELGISDWNSLFWIVHSGGPAILKEIEAKVRLNKEKLRASWHILREYGNMLGTSVFFILDEMRRKSLEEGKSTTGEGLEWGVLFGFGPGVTVETIVLRSVPIITTSP